MGLLGRILQFIIWVLVATWLGRVLFGWLFGSLGSNQRSSVRATAEPERRQLYRDPVCGTHVPAQLAVTLEDSGEIHHFCSAECRKQYAASHERQRRSVSA